MKTKMVSYTLDTLPRTDGASAGATQGTGRRSQLRDRHSVTSPSWTDEQWKNAVRGRFYRPIKKQITARLDADVLDWLKKQGKGYQSRMNAILRREMLISLKTTTK